LPLLSSFLEGLNALQDSGHSSDLKELFVELCLKVPVKLTILLPCLRLLVKPLILSLEMAGDLGFYGLRINELCIEHLRGDNLEPLFGEMKPRLMRALWYLLRPSLRQASQVLRIKIIFDIKFLLK